MCLSQNEREALLARNIELAAGPKERIFTGQFYLYQMMGKPAEKLFILYPEYTMGGEVKNPSYLVGVLKDILPNVTKSQGEDLEPEETYFCPELAFSHCLLQPEEAGNQELLAYLKQDETYRKRIETIANVALTKKDVAALSNELFKRLYSDEIKGSITRLETFARCRRRHFLEYGLELRERNTGQFTLMDVGILLHGAMEQYATRLLKSEYEADTIPEVTRVAWTKEAVQAAVADLRQTFLFENARNSYQIERVGRIARRATWAMAKQKAEDGFVPTYFEKVFHLEPEKEKDMLNLPGEIAMRLNGKIDRIDVKKTEEGVWYRVVDYKSGNTKLDFNRVYDGIQLQLVTYDYAGAQVLAKEGTPDSTCDGVYYFHMKDPMITLDPGKGIGVVEEKLLKELSLTGAQNQELPTLVAYTKHKIHELGCELVTGKTDGNPTKEAEVLYCTYCPYQGACGFEESTDYKAIRPVKTEKAEEVLGKMNDILEKGTEKA
jgi:ATP-dependent helicase/nuclease subunit B